jgi:hypothetical protein
MSRDQISPRGNLFGIHFGLGSGRRRKRSDDNQSISKRGKTQSTRSSIALEFEGTDVISDAEDSFEDSVEEPSMATNRESMKQAMFDVLSDDAMSETLIKKFSNCCDDKIAAATSDISSKIDELAKATTSQIENVDTRLGNLEQDKRCNNLLIRGIEPGSNPRQACINSLNKLLDLKLKTEDVKYALTIGNRKDRLVKVVFVNTGTRDEIYKQRSKLKGKEVWITEDLTPKKAALFYKARQAVKEGRATLAWTNEGKIFVKTGSNDKPTIISSEDQLPQQATPTKPATPESSD